MTLLFFAISARGFGTMARVMLSIFCTADCCLFLQEALHDVSLNSYIHHSTEYASHVLL